MTACLQPATSLGVQRNTRLQGYVREHGSDLFRELNPQPWVDVLYAVRLGRRGDVGVSARHYRDLVEDTGATVAVSATDLTAGAHWQFGGCEFDAAVSFRATNLDDARIEQDNSTGWGFDLRGRLPVSATTRIVPLVAVEVESFALAPSVRDFTSVTGGVGVNVQPSPGVLAVFGLLLRYEKTESGQRRDKTLTLPSVAAGAEAQIGSMLFRLGIRNDNTVTESDGDSTLPARRDYDVGFETNLGMGLEFGPLMIDGRLERDFLRDGPHLIGGSRHGGGIFSAVSLSYSFSD